MILLAVPIVLSQKGEIKGFVNDYADIIDESTEQQLNPVLQQLYDTDTAQYSIVTVISLEGQDIESYSLNLAQGKLGDKEKNNGLLLLVSLEDRRYRFEVGRGLEYILNDAKVGRIGRYYLVPNFQEGNYGKGILEASLAVKSILMGENESEYYISENEGYDEEQIRAVFFSLLVFLIIFSNLFIFIARRRKFKNRYFDAAAAAIIIFGGRGGSGGGHGGFGGFGGGGFGGGGASGGF
jgi:uncharacterized protein